jgi:CHAT domain-containing protein
MGIAGGTLRGLVRAAPLLSVFVGGLASAAVPDRLCAGAPMSETMADESLMQAAASAETMLASSTDVGRTGDEVMGMLDKPGGAAGVPSAAALARFCAAAGEAARISTAGSQFKAATYLTAALRYADDAGSADVAALSAYRLGLNLVVGNALVAGSRGAARGRGLQRGTAALALEGVLPAADSGDCEAIRDPAKLLAAGRAAVVQALQCAVNRARAGHSPVGALASLRLARFQLALAENAAEPGKLRNDAASEVLSAITLICAQAPAADHPEVLARLVETALSAGSTDFARLSAAIAAMRAGASGDRGLLAFASALDGRVALAQGNHAGAAAAIQKAVFYEGQRAQPLRMADWLLLLADAQPSQRQRHVAAAYRALESVRPILPLTDPLTEESNFALHMRKVFEAAVDTELANGASDETLSIQNVQRIVETYREAELQSAFGSECVPARSPIQPAELSANEIVLYPIVLPDRIELIYATGSGADARFHRLPANRSISQSEVRRLVADVVSLTLYNDDYWEAPAARLYELLIKPIEDKLSPETTLVIVPDAALRPLPFAALRDGRGDFLIERTRLSLAPALSYSQPGVSRSTQPKVLAASVSQEVDIPAGSFAALNSTQNEAKVAAGFDDPQAKRGKLIEDFTKAELVSAIERGGFDALHLATHASFNGRSDRSFIVALDQPIKLDELRTYLARGRTRGDELNLLVLSACETAVGDDEASMGLAGVAVQAGARSVIASLWQVNDAGTARLMSEFYKSYRRGASTSEALRDAQLAMIREEGDEPDPVLWASFTLLGGWR